MITIRKFNTTSSKFLIYDLKKMLNEYVLCSAFWLLFFYQFLDFVGQKEQGLDFTIFLIHNGAELEVLH